ncbi:hypothetical protein GPECTOR_5g364 [Gonium pectorale]|uniref:Uncharacterized protein n=1 Tax=Gonium pectorale TaxID=33097 RepID=A0A150GWK1_GONPE|nr:hypothetical protein GPECTOR_5g364 [Gonium pectorale]|eukprot:KXZ54276.1 hypothetical protein GPECTOR_5g364 [Gonium pectorale]
MAARGLSDSGVLNARGVMDHVEMILEEELGGVCGVAAAAAKEGDSARQRPLDEVSPRRVVLWARCMEQRPQLLLCLSKQTNWLQAKAVTEVARHENLLAHVWAVAQKIAAMHQDLDNDIVTFMPSVGLIIGHHLHDQNTAEALVCICTEFGIPYARVGMV